MAEIYCRSFECEQKHGLSEAQANTSTWIKMAELENVIRRTKSKKGMIEIKYLKGY